MPKRKMPRRAGRSSKRARTSYHLPDRNYIGKKAGINNTKYNLVMSNRPISNEHLSYRALKTKEVTAINRGVGINERERDLVNFIGIKYDLFFQNFATPVANVVGCNVAFLAPKGAQSTVNDASFFRSHAENSNRGANFNAVLTGLERHTLPVNTDKYVVLRHHRFRLSAVTAGEMYHSRYLSGYLPINRQLTYSGTDSACDTPIYIVFWTDLMNQDEGNTESPNRVLLSARVINLFKEPK